MVKPIIIISTLTLALSLFSNCQKRVLSPSPLFPKSIRIQTLKALNLSEDMNEVSTKDDEILLLIFLLKSQSHSSAILSEQSFEYTFTQRNEMAEVNQTIAVPTPLANTKLFFVLTELDNEQSAAQVQETVRQFLSTHPNFQNLETTSLDKALGHDDFLDLQYLSLDQLNSTSPRTLRFSGLQLFDRFEYVLDLKINQ